MSDEERDVTGESGPEEALTSRFVRLRRLMRHQDLAERNLDPRFAARLRATLVGTPRNNPDPAFARDLRARLVASRPAGRLGIPRRMTVRGALSTLAVFAVVVVAALNAFPGQPLSGFAKQVPYPRQADLLFSYPSLPSIQHTISPLESLVHPGRGVAYAGSLQLLAPRLSLGTPKLPAYRLAASSAISLLARRLDIESRAKRLMSGGEPWVVAVDGGRPSHRPLHSVAVSLTTGELIYHDRRNSRLPRATHAMGRRQAVDVARRWLERLGWPGRDMPLRSTVRLERKPKIWQIEFGWHGVGEAATSASTLWVVPDGSVVEAWLWPPVSQAGLVPGRSVQSAWAEVRSGLAPLAVQGVPPNSTAAGTGEVRDTSVVVVLSRGKDGREYLVPTYRFKGAARLHRIRGSHVWYALTPAGLK